MTAPLPVARVRTDRATDRFHSAYQPTSDTAPLRRGRGPALGRALACILIGDSSVQGRPGGQPTWGQPAHAPLQRLTTNPLAGADTSVE
jgi:hypothetical protein